MAHLSGVFFAIYFCTGLTAYVLAGNICDDFLGTMTILDNSRRDHFRPSNAMRQVKGVIQQDTPLNSFLNKGYWKTPSSGSTDSGQRSHMQIDLRKASLIRAIVARGCRQEGSCPITKYRLMYSEDNISWNYYSMPGTRADAVFVRDNDCSSFSRYDFQCPFLAKHIRIVPHGYRFPCNLSVDLYGCFLHSDDVLPKLTSLVSTPIAHTTISTSVGTSVKPQVTITSTSSVPNIGRDSTTNVRNSVPTKHNKGYTTAYPPFTNLTTLIETSSGKWSKSDPPGTPTINTKPEVDVSSKPGSSGTPTTGTKTEVDVSTKPGPSGTPTTGTKTEVDVSLISTDIPSSFTIREQSHSSSTKSQHLPSTTPDHGSSSETPRSLPNKPSQIPDTTQAQQSTSTRPDNMPDEKSASKKGQWFTTSSSTSNHQPSLKTELPFPSQELTTVGYIDTRDVNATKTTHVSSSRPSSPLIEVLGQSMSTKNPHMMTHHPSTDPNDLFPAFGCVKSCLDRKDGHYHSCKSCKLFVTCSNEVLFDHRPCPSSLIWDDHRKQCAYHSQTCKLSGVQNNIKS